MYKKKARAVISQRFGTTLLAVFDDELYKLEFSDELYKLIMG
jgi:hypothetical protein